MGRPHDPGAVERLRDHHDFETLSAKITTGWSKLDELRQILSSPASGPFSRTREGGGLLSSTRDVIATLAADATWRKLTTYVDEAGFKTIVFTRFVPAGALALKLSFGAGFRPQEGPLPDQRLPTFHWMIADTATLTVRDTADAAPSKSFGLQCESIADINLSVLDASGRMLVTKEIRAKVATGHFDTIIVPLDSGAGSSTNLSLRLKAPGVATGPWPGLVLCAASAVATD